MEDSSRTRTILGIGLVLIGCLLLFRSFSAPIFPGIAPGPRAGHDAAPRIRIEEQREQIEAQIEAQREQIEAQVEAQRAQIEAQVEAQQAQTEAQHEQFEVQAEARRAQIEAQREQFEAQAEARRAQIEAQAEARMLPPVPPMPPAWHIGGWLKPSVVLLILLILMLWRRGRSEHTPAQV
jgi:hypothetical protein